MGKFIYEPTDNEVSYGYYHCPDCDQKFYGGGRALHKQGCRYHNLADYDAGYEPCDYHFGPKVVAWVMRTGKSDGVTLSDLQREFPHLLR